MRFNSGSETEMVDHRRRLALAGAAALGALVASRPAQAVDIPPPFFAIKQAGAVGDGVADDTAAFTRFDAAGGGWVMPYATTGTTFFIAGTWSPSHSVIIGPGAVLKLGASANVTLANVTILDDAAQCFDNSSGGALTIGHVNGMSPFCFGAKGDGVTDDTAAFQRWDAAGGGRVPPAGPSGTSFYLNGTWSAAHRVTISPGAIVKTGTSANIAIADLVLADDYSQAFNTGLGGTLSIGKVNRLTPYHFGAVGDGNNDDTAAIAATIAATPAYGHVAFPKGIFAVSAALPQSAVGVTYRGDCGAQIVKKSGTASVNFFTANTNNKFLGLNVNAGETIAGTILSSAIYSRATPINGVEVAFCLFAEMYYGVNAWGPSNWNIHDNHCSAASTSTLLFQSAIYIGHSSSFPVSNIRIEGNIVGACRDAGITLYPIVQPGQAAMVVVAGNIVTNTNMGATHGNDGFAIDIEKSTVLGNITDILIADNLVQQLASGANGAYRGGISSSQNTRVNIRDNVVVCDGQIGSVYSGIDISFASYSVVADNEIYNSTGDGVSMWGSLGCSVENNQIVNCGSASYAGIRIAEAGTTTTDARVRGNRITLLSGYANAPTAMGIVYTGNTSWRARDSGIAITENLIENIAAAPGIQLNGGMAGVTGNTLVNCTSANGAIGLFYTAGTFVSGNKIYGAVVGMGGSTNIDMQVVGNYFHDDRGVTRNHVNFTGTNTNCGLLGNVFRESSTAPAGVIAQGFIILRNFGAAGAMTEKAGTATIGTSASSVTVRHGLAVTPTPGQISLTPNGNISPATQFWVNGIGPITFTINLNEAPTSSVVFGWSARLP